MNPSALNIGQDSVVVYTLTPDLDALQDHRLFTRDELCVATSFIAEAPQSDASSADGCVPDCAGVMLQRALVGAAQTEPD